MWQTDSLQNFYSDFLLLMGNVFWELDANGYSFARAYFSTIGEPNASSIGVRDGSSDVRRFGCGLRSGRASVPGYAGRVHGSCDFWWLRLRRDVCAVRRPIGWRAKLLRKRTSRSRQLQRCAWKLLPRTSHGTALTAKHGNLRLSIRTDLCPWGNALPPNVHRIQASRRSIVNFNKNNKKKVPVCPKIIQTWWLSQCSAQCTVIK